MNLRHPPLQRLDTARVQPAPKFFAHPWLTAAVVLTGGFALAAILSACLLR